MDNQPPANFQPRYRLKWYRRWWGKLLLSFFVIFLVVMVAWGFYVGHLVYLIRTGQLDSEQLFGNSTNSVLVQENQLPTLATADDPSFGPADAKIVIVEFSDFECPACGEVYPVVAELLKNYGDQIRFVFRDFPLTDLHPNAVKAAVAAQCANDQGKFWPMYDKLFTNQENLTETDLKTYAIQIGLNSLQFGNCLDSDRFLSEVEADLAEGIAAGVNATPTFFINGFKVEGVVPLSVFQKIIVAELNK